MLNWVMLEKGWEVRVGGGGGGEGGRGRGVLGVGRGGANITLVETGFTVQFFVCKKFRYY